MELLLMPLLNVLLRYIWTELSPITDGVSETLSGSTYGKCGVFWMCVGY